MGHIWVEALIENSITGKSVRVRALVDTGTTFTIVPRKVFKELQLPIVGKKTVKTVKGSVELSECLGVIEVMGRRAGSQILVSDDVDLTLIGVLTLEALGLEVDPTTWRLKETEILLL
jgi:clan AA aspartic protease